ncbi:MAG: leucine-rich repeat protein [Oscillospiraceae bacterium]|nr:leucine-rich repeat protein [Oscillospiraceae bacterium]
MKSVQRILAGILVLVLLLTNIPVQALAHGTSDSQQSSDTAAETTTSVVTDSQQAVVDVKQEEPVCTVPREPEASAPADTIPAEPEATKPASKSPTEPNVATPAHGTSAEVRASWPAGVSTFGSLLYQITGGQVTIIGCDTAATGELVIPDTIEGCPVTSIGGWAFVHCKSLTSVIIPNCVTAIGEDAFYDCDSLTSVTIPDSVTTIDRYAFSSCNTLTSVTVGISVTTIGNYAFSDCPNLTSVTIPDNVTSIGNYTFRNCNQLTIRAVPASYAWTYAEEHNIPFFPLVTIQDLLRLNIKNEEGNTVREGIRVNWYIPEESTPIATGTVLSNLETGTYEYEIIVDPSLVFTYIQPQRGSVDYEGGTVDIEQILESVGQVQISGIVTNQEGAPIKGATLCLTQVSCNTERTVTATTAADGSYALDVYAVAVSGTLSASGYYSRAVNLNLSKDMPQYTLNAALSPLPSNKITLSLYVQKTGSDNYEVLSYNEVDLQLQIKNLTSGTYITNFEFQSGNLVIAGDEASPADTLQITATDPTGAMLAEPVEVTLDQQKNGSASIYFLERGQIVIKQLTGCEDKLLMLFDAQGKFQKAQSVTSGYTSEALAAGQYTLVLLQKTGLLRSVPSLSALKQYGLVAGTDYARTTVTVENGVLTQLDSVFVPALDLSKLYYTVEENTYFTASKSLAFAGEYIVLRVAYEIDSKFPSSGQQVHIRLPEQLTFEGSSLTLDGKAHPYTLDSNELIVNTNRRKGVIRFYIAATSAGNYQIQADLSFMSGGDRLLQPLGSVEVKTVAAHLELPKKTCNGQITVTGKAMPGSTIIFYDTGVQIGTATSNGVGSFYATLPLDLAGKLSYHQISATVSNERLDQPLAVESQLVINDESLTQVSKITMVNTGDNGENISIFNMVNPGPAPQYRFFPGRYPKFTFIVEFEGDGANRAEKVNVITVSSSGDETVVPCFYDEVNDRWVGTHNYYSINDAPVSVTATYDIAAQDDENSVLQLDMDLLNAYAERFEDDIYGDYDLSDYDDDAVIPEDSDEGETTTLEQFIRNVEQINSEVEQLFNDIYYAKQTHFAQYGIVYEETDNSVSYEIDGTKLVFSYEDLTGITEEELLNDGYTLMAAGDGTSVYQRALGNEGMDIVTFQVTADGVEALRNSTTITQQTQTRNAFTESVTDPSFAYNTVLDACSTLYDAELEARAARLNSLVERYDEQLQQSRKAMMKAETEAQWKAFQDQRRPVMQARAKANLKLGSTLREAGKLKLAGKIAPAFAFWQTYQTFRDLENQLASVLSRLPALEDCPEDMIQHVNIDNAGRQLKNDISKAYWLCTVADGGCFAMTFTPAGFLLSTAVGLAVSTAQNSTVSNLEQRIRQLDRQIDTLDCNGDGEPDTPYGSPFGNYAPAQPTRVVIDPSGYVYEAVPSNRVEGVKAEVYYLGYALDEWGVPKEEPEDILWDAEYYDQVNPLYTDELGMFQWDVPVGQWLVKFSKEGYYDTDSRNDPAADNDGYLPVPPPQVEVNTAIVSKAAPVVEQVNVYDDQVQIIFSQYMQLNTVNTGNVTVLSNGKAISGTIAPANAEYNYEQTTQYASIFIFTPNEALGANADVQIRGCVNYAGKAMAAPYAMSGTVTYRPESIDVGENHSVLWNSESVLPLQILPAQAGANQTLSVQVHSSMLLKSSAQIVTTDENGRANVTLTGLLPGSSDVTVKLEGTDIQTTFSVAVKQPEPEVQTCAKVTASLPSGSVVMSGTQLSLSTETEDAQIYYTLDGTCPCVVDSPSRILYTQPIELHEDTFLIAYAVKEGMKDSATAGFIYQVQDGPDVNEDQSYKLYMDNGAKLYFNGQTESEEVTFRLGATDNADEAVDVYLEEADGGYRLYFMDGENKVYIRIYERIDDAPGYGKGSLELVDYPPEELLSVDSVTGTLFYMAPSGKNSYYMGTYGSYSTFSISNTSYITGENAGKVGISQFPAKLEGLSSEIPSQPIPPLPEEAVFEDYTYLLINGQVTITKYTGSAAELEIPSQIEGYPVTAIDLYAFSNNETLTAVTVPDSVITIGESAFAQCQNLYSVTLGNSVTVIGFGAFQNCSNLTSINIPDSVTDLLDYAFSNCRSLTDIHLPNSLDVIGYGCFVNCSNLSSISIPESVTYIGDYALFGCESLTGIWVDENNPFYCSDSYGVLFSKDQTELLQTPATLSGDYSIPDSVTRICDSSFCWCPELTGIWAGENNPSYSSDSFGVLFDKDKTTLIHAPGTLSGSYSIPDSVTAIGDYGFLGCGILTAITIPDSVTSIGSDAFSFCHGLTEMTIPDSVTSVGSGMFYDCTGLTSVTIPDSITGIYDWTFYNCASLTEITIPDSVTEIGNCAFYYCTGLKKVVIGDGVTYIGVSAFDHCVSLTGITIPDSVTVIGDWSFTHCTSLTEAIIGNSVSIIGADAFSCCEALTQLTIPDSVTEIAKGAFWSCTGLKEIIIGGCVTTIGDDVFGDCISLTSITIPDSVTEIGSWAFQNCSALTEVVIGNGVTFIGEGAFCQCPLTDVYYADTQSQWDQIDINGYCNEPLLDATFHYYEPLQVLSQPKAQNLVTGKTAVFTVSAEGTQLRYQWQYRTSANGKWANATATGNKTATLKVPVTATRNGYQYRCVITDCFGNVVNSKAATLKVVTLKVTAQPANANLPAGKTAKFTVKASGTGLKYQWQYRTSSKGSWKNTSATGSKTATVSVPATATRNGYQYRCKITDQYGNVIYSSAATLKIVTLKVTGQPTSKYLPAGKTAKFTVKVSGTGLKYQWQYRTSAKGSWKNTSATGSKTATLSVGAIAARNGYQYRCKITDKYGNVIYSNAATLKIVTLKITTQPASVTLAKGKTATFKVVAKGTGLTYQWQYRTSAKGAWKKATNTGNKTATLKVPVTAARNGYQYRCVITDKYGNVIYSNAATLKAK